MSPMPRARTANFRLRAHLGVLASALLLAACGGAEDKDKPASQIAARVNKEEISVHQINFMLQRQQNLKPEQMESASRLVLDRLVDQELTVQKAIEQKMDRDPAVVQALDAARREIISRAYIDRIGNGVSPPSAAEITAYYEKNPALFSERRIFQLQEFLVEGPAEALTALQAQLAKAKDPTQIAKILSGSGQKVRASQAVRSAEQIPLGSIGRFAKMRDGEVMLNLSGTNLQVIYLASSRNAPVTEAQARPAIERFLINERKRELITKDLKGLRDVGKVEYLGKFADMKDARPSGGPEAASANALDLPTPPAAEQAAPAPAPAPTPAPASAADATSNDMLDRGVRGLK